MSELIAGFRPFCLVASGAIIGSWTRMYITDYFAIIFPAKYWGTIFVNVLATFFLGFFLRSSSQLTI
ncbi:FluC/FEX family fluoride channel [Prochlorococcus sp. MIT 1307]|uniref:FluC/FEX family fluoride channel n=1 Tax=Prochlorococcus sp. MIT 1307 TaxID=3096219 RepID=UPI0039BF05FA